MPLQATSGAASYDAFGGGAAVAPKYIEDFFQIWLRTGTGASVTVTTGLNASINKSLVWTKVRSSPVFGGANHKLTDTVRGATKALSSNTTDAEVTDSQGLTAFSSTGYTIGTNTDYNRDESSFGSNATYVDWQWLATPKFFDVVTWTGNGANRTIAHNLGSVPGCIVVKRTDTTADWQVYHRSLANTQYMVFNGVQGVDTGATRWNSTTPTSTVFSLGTDATVNASGGTYVAYVYAHDAGGFGLEGTDNVISCGSYTGNGSSIGPTITLGYEPQWVLIKRTTGLSQWVLVDSMRGMTASGSSQMLNPNQTSQENNVTYIAPQSTGFNLTSGGADVNETGNTYIYIAIRRGPMKVPTTGTSVFAPLAYVGNQSSTRRDLDVGFPVDSALFLNRARANYQTSMMTDRLRGAKSLSTNSTAAESDLSNYLWFDDQNGVDVGQIGDLNPVVAGIGETMVLEAFRRAPGFFDVVCYTGTGSARTVAHNLTVAPELIICKRRNSAGFDWLTYCAYLNGGVTPQNWWVKINGNSPQFDSNSYWNDTSPTSTVFSLGTEGDVNASGATYVAYLFASCPGVSKVGNYTGNGSSQTINCGFTGGARFVMIKRTDSTGDWYVWDTARGIVTGNDPHLSLNTTAAEVTSNDTIDTDSTGFVVNQVAATNVNVNAATYIFLAVS